MSLTLRAVFVAALFGGVNWLAWAYVEWRNAKSKDEDDNTLVVSFVLAGLITALGLAGTFRRGKAEDNFSIFDVAGVAVGLGTGHFHISTGQKHGRTLRRFPTFESLVLGGFLIALWLGICLWREEIWVLRNGAIIGAVQILWGLTLGRPSSTLKP